jgi:hypothetical protein
LIGALFSAALVLDRSQAWAQELTLEYQQVATRAVPGATAAFSLDQSRVSAVAKEGVLTLVGVRPGATHVIIVLGERSESFQVLVKDPPTFFLPGFGPADSHAAEAGHYELRFGTDPRVLQGTLGVSRREGEFTTELSLGSAALLDATADTHFSIPLASFSLRSPAREITLLDAVVANSPLTVSRSTVRGLHLKSGPWQLHAGYNFFANFEHLLLSTDQQSVVGVGYRQALGARSSITPNLFHFGGEGDESHRGFVGTMLYEAEPAPATKVLAEIAVGRVLAGAAEIEIARPERRVWGKVRFAPNRLPSLATDQPNGRFIEGGWVRYGARLTANANVSSQRYSQGALDQASSIASFDLRYRRHDIWTIHGGAGYSIFDTAARPGSRIQNVTLPIGAGVARGPLGADVDYQFSRETARDLAGHLVRAAVNGSSRAFHFSAHWERQTQAPTAGYILAQVPWLQQALDQLGISASTPEQLAELLRTNATLAAYGYANNVRIDVTPLRTRLGLSGGWRGSGTARPNLYFSTLTNRDALIDGLSHGAVHMLSFSRSVGAMADLLLSGSLTCHDRPATASSCHPVASVSIRRRLQRVARLLPRHRAEIGGTVFRDDRAQGAYAPGMPVVPGVEIVLDGARRTIADAQGRYRFGDVAHGKHRVELRYATKEAFFLTTPSPREVDAGATADFGVAASQYSLRGVVRTDAGNGLLGVIVHVANNDRTWTCQTADDGTFVIEGLTPGNYTVRIELGSVPVGYALDGQLSQGVVIGQAAPARPTFVLRPYRSITGRVRLFDRRTGAYVPLTGETAELLESHRHCTTDESGTYVFRDLTAGDYTVVIGHEGQQYTASAKVPDGPASLRNVDIAIVR